MEDLVAFAVTVVGFWILLLGAGLWVGQSDWTSHHAAGAVGDAPQLERLARRLTAAAWLVLLGVLVYRLIDAGGIEWNNEHHSHAVGGLLLIPFTALLAKLAARVARRGDKDFIPRWWARWAVGTLVASPLASVALVLWLWLR